MSSLIHFLVCKIYLSRYKTKLVIKRKCIHSEHCQLTENSVYSTKTEVFAMEARDGMHVRSSLYIDHCRYNVFE